MDKEVECDAIGRAARGVPRLAHKLNELCSNFTFTFTFTFRLDSLFEDYGQIVASQDFSASN